MTDRYRDTERLQSFDISARGDIAALNGIPEVLHYLGDTGHTDPADTDEMNGADRKRHFLHAATSVWPLIPPFPLTPITETTKSANFPAASGLPMRPAHFAALFKVGPGANKAVRR